MSPKIRHARLWRASVTPLASIIGSGFLVIGPVLIISFGAFAPIAMLGLCFFAFALGAGIRFNMLALDNQNYQRNEIEQQIERLSSWVLVLAYVISVSYYLNLFGAFAVSLSSTGDKYIARLITSSCFFVILVSGLRNGFSALEKLEYLFVTAKLSIIFGLILGLLLFFTTRALDGNLQIHTGGVSGLSGLYLAFGLVVTVQGFEISRYLGDMYDVEVRIRSMLLAQKVSTLIYLLYILLLAYLFDPTELSLTETAIIDLMFIVAPILPGLLVAAALSAQFSAAVADTGGAGGLMFELSHRWLSVKSAYLLLTISGLFLTWSFNVFEIISFASRAFALYYSLQTLLAAMSSWRLQENILRCVCFAILSLVALAASMFGLPVE